MSSRSGCSSSLIYPVEYPCCGDAPIVAGVSGFTRHGPMYGGLTEPQIDQKIADIEGTTAQVLQDAESMPSTHAAAVALADQRIAAGPQTAQEQVHAG